MIRYEMSGTIADINRLRNSENGNPRWQIILVTGEVGAQMYRTLNTASDAAISYEIGNPGFRVNDDVTVTMNGRGTISNIKQGVDA